MQLLQPLGKWRWMVKPRAQHGCDCSPLLPSFQKLCFKLWKAHHRFFPVVFWGSAVVEFLSARGLLQSPWRRILIDVFFHRIISLTPYKIIPIPYHQWRSMKGGYCIISNFPNLLIDFRSHEFLSSDLFDLGHWLFSPTTMRERLFWVSLFICCWSKTRWWFQICFMFTPNLGKISHFWLIFFRWVFQPPTRKRLFSAYSIVSKSLRDQVVQFLPVIELNCLA